MGIYCGIDWAEAHHDVAPIDEDGQVLAHRRISTDAAGLGTLLELLAEQAGDPTTVPVAIKTDKNLIVVGVLAAGVRVHAINPRACARYRERHSQSGGKSDPGDALVLASILRTDGHLHRPLPELLMPPGPSKRWRASTRRRSGRCTRPRCGCARCCWSTTRRPSRRSPICSTGRR